jgi:hypothetical protein
MPDPPPDGSYRGNSIIDQFTGIALLGCLIGAVTLIVPLVFHWAFYILPVAGLLAGVFAVRRGQRIGGAVAMALSAIGATLTLMAVSR